MSTPISRRSFLSLLSLAVVTLFCPKPAYGFAKGKHDNIIEKILFGQSGWSGMGSEVLEG